MEYATLPEPVAYFHTMAISNRALQGALDATVTTHGPGVFGLVTEHGETIFEGAAGVADIARPRLITGRDRFRTGSITKIYVTVVVMQLIDEQVLALDDTVEVWLPGLVSDGDRITVELLLRMRSGLPNYLPDLFGDPPDLAVLARYWAPTDLVRIALAAPGRVPAGTRYRYSSTEYVLLGMIIEKATGQRIDAQLWQRIFAPLRLDQTSFMSADPHLRGPHACGYVQVDPASYLECTTATPSESWTAGAIVSTPHDVAAFLDGLFDGNLLSTKALAAMIDCREIIDAQRARGLGMVRYTFGPDTVAYGHQGALAGFTGVVMRTTAGRCVILYQNCYDVASPLPYNPPFVELACSAK